MYRIRDYYYINILHLPVTFKRIIAVRLVKIGIIFLCFYLFYAVLRAKMMFSFRSERKLMPKILGFILFYIRSLIRQFIGIY